MVLVASDAGPINNQHETDQRQSDQQPPTCSIDIVQSPNADADTWNESDQREGVAETDKRHNESLALRERLKASEEKRIYKT